MSIHNLPDEVLLLIGEQLSIPDFSSNTTGHDRFHLLQVCRRWNSLFFSLAWRDIKLDQIYHLVSAIQRNPRIGASIQNLSMEWGYSGNGPYNIEAYQGLVEQASHSIEHSEEWKGALKDGDLDAWVAVLVPSLKSVRSLTVQFTECPIFFMPIVARAAAREKPFDTKPIFQRLEHVRVKQWDDSLAHYTMEDLLPFCYFPAMRSFGGNAICEEPGYSYSKEYPKIPAGTSGIKKLDFGYNAWTSNGRDGFKDVIDLCQGLEIFEYQHDDLAISPQVSFPFSPREFYTSLSSQKHSLREIRLNSHGEHPWDFRNANMYDCDSDYEVGKFGSLVDFHQLRELQMPWATLTQADDSNGRPTVELSEILPTGLEFLNLTNCRREDLEIVVEIIQKTLPYQQERLPNLKTLKIQPVDMKQIGVHYVDESSFEVPQGTIDTFAPVAKSCQEMGIEFGFDKGGNHTMVFV